MQLAPIDLTSPLYVVGRPNGTGQNLTYIVVNNVRKVGTAYDFANNPPLVWSRNIVYTDSTTVLFEQSHNSLRLVEGVIHERYMDNNTMDNVFHPITQSDKANVDKALMAEQKWFDELLKAAASGGITKHE